MTGPADAAAEADRVEWVCHPARHRPVAAVLVTACVALLVGVVAWRFADAFLAALAALILGFSLAPFYLPTRYRITQDTVSIRTVFGSREKPWDLFRRWEVDRHGALLSPFDRPSRLDRRQGLYLRFDEPDRERVVACLGRRLQGHERQA